MNAAVCGSISLEGKTALVTGGARGIGRAICLTLARAGAFVVVNSRTTGEPVESTLRLLKDQGGNGMAAQFDVTDQEQVDTGVGEVLAARGTIDILVNNAGIARDNLLARMKDADWKEVIETNLTGAFHVCRTVSKTMIRKRGGRIVNMASTAGEIGNAGQANYSAAKAGLIGFTRALARELAPRNILVNAVAPGIISGGMTQQLTQKQIEAVLDHVPLGTMGRPEDVASAVLFLSGPMATYITGQVIRVNGGLYM